MSSIDSADVSRLFFDSGDESDYEVDSVSERDSNSDDQEVPDSCLGHNTGAVAAPSDTCGGTTKGVNTVKNTDSVVAHNDDEDGMDDLEKARRFIRKVRSMRDDMTSPTSTDPNIDSSVLATQNRQQDHEVGKCYNIGASDSGAMRNTGGSGRSLRSSTGGGTADEIGVDQYREDLDRARSFIHRVRENMRSHRVASMENLFLSARHLYAKGEGQPSVNDGGEAAAVFGMYKPSCNQDEVEDKDEYSGTCGNNSDSWESLAKKEEHVECSHSNGAGRHFKHLLISVPIVVALVSTAITLAFLSIKTNRDVVVEEEGAGDRHGEGATTENSVAVSPYEPFESAGRPDLDDGDPPGTGGFGGSNVEEMLISLLNPITDGVGNLRTRHSHSFKAMQYILHDDPFGLVNGMYPGPGVDEVLDNRIRQRFALAALVYSTGEVLADWMTAETSSKNKWLSILHECHWEGVSCRNVVSVRNRGSEERENGNSEDNFVVVGLDLTGCNLSGSLPRELSALTHLEQLVLGGNNLAGPIPIWIRTDFLPNLRELFLNDNRFTGEVPSQLALLPKLEQLWLQGNDLRGTMPLEFCRKEEGDWDEPVVPILAADCLGSNPKVMCKCCSVCK